MGLRGEPQRRGGTFSAARGCGASCKLAAIAATPNAAQTCLLDVRISVMTLRAPPAALAPVAAAGTGAAAPPPLAVVAAPPVAIIAAVVPVPLPLAWPFLFKRVGRRGAGRMERGRMERWRPAPAAAGSTAA